MAFPINPTNGQLVSQFDKPYIYDSTLGVWRSYAGSFSGASIDVLSDVDLTVAPEDGQVLTWNAANSEFVPGEAASGTNVYTTIAELPLSGNDDGSLAFVSGNNRLYIWNGAGWFNIAMINTSPSITTGPDASYAFAVDGTPIVLTLVAEDPEGFPITWSYQVTTGSLGSTATVGQSDNVFTITPSTSEADIGAFGITFTASDGINLATAASSFSLSFGPNWSLTTQQQKIVASDIQANDNFGYSVAISGDTAVVGAQYEDIGGTSAGAAYVFTRSGTTWTEQQKIQASDKQASDFFGYSVAIDGDTAVVGAWYEETGATDSGSAYIFTRSGTTWTQQQKIVSSDLQAFDQFGASVSIDGDTVVVGATGEDTGGQQAGAAYVFTRSGTTWTQQQKIQASDIGAGDGFGISVSISGDTVVVGAQLEDTGGADAGAAYVFTRSGTTWTQQAKIQSSDIEANDRFGYSVAIDGDTVVVSAYYEDTGGTNAGAAYIFTRSGTTWTQQQKIQASDAEAIDQFGWSVSIDGDTVVVGAFAEDTGGTSAGAAYIFTRDGTTWTQQQKIQASDVQAGDQFGISVSIDGETVVVGAQLEDTGGSDAGAAYIFVAG